MTWIADAIAGALSSVAAGTLATAVLGLVRGDARSFGDAARVDAGAAVIAFTPAVAVAQASLPIDVGVYAEVGQPCSSGWIWVYTGRRAGDLAFFGPNQNLGPDPIGVEEIRSTAPARDGPPRTRPRRTGGRRPPIRLSDPAPGRPCPHRRARRRGGGAGVRRSPRGRAVRR